MVRNQRIYRCSVCQFTANQKRNFNAHNTTHTGEKPHVCPDLACGRAFGDPSSLIRHRKALHKYVAKTPGRRKRPSGDVIPTHIKHETMTQPDEDTVLQHQFPSSPSTSSLSLSDASYASYASYYQDVQYPLCFSQSEIIPTNQSFPENFQTFSASPISTYDHSSADPHSFSLPASNAGSIQLRDHSGGGVPCNQPQVPYGGLTGFESSAGYLPPLQNAGYQSDVSTSHFDDRQTQGTAYCLGGEFVGSTQYGFDDARLSNLYDTPYGHVRF